MAQSAPAAIALARSPEYLMPPSAITGVPVCCAASTASVIAVSCGTPTPAITRVVQIEPGPMPTLMAVGTGIDQRLGAFGGGDVAGHDLHGVRHALDAADGIEHAPRMAVGGVDDDQIDAGFDQRFAARIAGLADTGRGGDPQPALLVLAGIGVRHRLLDILHRDQADAAIVAVDHQKLLDAVLVQQAAWLRPGSRLRAP